MANLKEIRGRIQSVSSTQQITKAMKMVAAAKLRRAQDNILRMRPYAQRLNSILANLSQGAGEDVTGPYGVVREVRRVLVIAVTADRGLAGAFHSNVYKGITQLLQDRYATQAAAGNVTVMAIGRKAHDYLGKRFPLLGDYTHVFSKLSFDTVRAAAEQAMAAYAAGQFDEVVIVYNEFKNVATQVVRVEQLLPLVQPEPTATGGPEQSINYIFEPSQDEIVRELIPTSLKVQLYRTVLESNASFFGSQMTAMDKATENAGELLKELKLTYNRGRQAAITNEILEIVGGAEALAASR